MEDLSLFGWASRLSAPGTFFKTKSKCDGADRYIHTVVPIVNATGSGIFRMFIYSERTEETERAMSVSRLQNRVTLANYLFQQTTIANV